MARQKMIQEDSATEMVSEPQGPLVTTKTPKVNMSLPGGKQLVAGEAVELSDEELSHLQKSFKAEDLSLILE